MPSPRRIFEHWLPLLDDALPEVAELLSEWRQMGRAGAKDWDWCWSCASDERGVDRAHLQGRCYDGLDTPHNLVLLCRPCHQQQPDHDHALAVSWLRERAHLSNHHVDLFGMLPILLDRDADSAWQIASVTMRSSVSDIDLHRLRPIFADQWNAMRARIDAGLRQYRGIAA
jgi:hypothetical protein